MRQAQLAVLAPEVVPPGSTRAGWQAALDDIGLSAEFYASYPLAFESVLAGRLPFPQPSPGALVIAHLRQALPDPRTRVPSLSPSIATALMRAIAKEPRERFGTAGEFIAALYVAPFDVQLTNELGISATQALAVTEWIVEMLAANTDELQQATVAVDETRKRLVTQAERENWSLTRLQIVANRPKNARPFKRMFLSIEKVPT